VLVAFGLLALARLIPGGYGRASVAAPVLLTVPGALTLGALIAGRRMQGFVFGSLTVLLSVLWSAFVPLALYLFQVQITPQSTYAGLLVSCAALAVAAQTRLSLARPGPGCHGADHESAASDGTDRGRAGLGSAGYAVIAFVAGAGLLLGCTYGYLHIARQQAAGYTSISWTGAPQAGVMTVGQAGAALRFRIDHEQPGTGVFRLTAAWTNAGPADAGQQHQLAAPVTVRIGPGKTVRGTLSVPSPPGACVYRIVVTLSTLGQARPRSWSVNVDVRAVAQGQPTCAS
jgi:hypothetical protein